MRRMFSEKQIEEMIASGISLDVLKPILDGSFVKIINAPESTTLTDEEIEQFQEGVFIEGEFLSQVNPVFTPAVLVSGTLRGLCISSRSLRSYQINTTTKVISFSGIDLQIYGLSQINQKNWPVYPASTGTFVFKCVDGILTWVEEV